MSSAIDEDRESISDHLQAPRRKRRNFVIVALSRGFDQELKSSIESYLKKNHSNISVAKPKNVKELKRFFARQIVLICIDDRFTSIDENINLVKSLKEKKKTEPAPALFFTEDEKSLIDKYRSTLPQYQEMDNYLLYKNMTNQQIFSRISEQLKKAPSRRKSRRYTVNLDVEFYDLKDAHMHKAKLVDLSLHGAALEIKSKKIFSKLDQISIRIPLKGVDRQKFKDFMKLSGKIRHVFIGGTRIGVSWEHMTEGQHRLLTEYLLNLVNKQTIAYD